MESIKYVCLCFVAVFFISLFFTTPVLAQNQTNASTPGLTISDERQFSNTTIDTIVVDSVTVPKGGFVVIFNNGQPIGHSEFLTPGEHTDIRVTLSEPLEKSTTLISLLYKDTNTNKEFESEWDLRYNLGDKPVSEPTQITFIDRQKSQQQPTENSDSDSDSSSGLEFIDIGILIALAGIPLLLSAIIGSYLYTKYKKSRGKQKR